MDKSKNWKGTKCGIKDQRFGMIYLTALTHKQCQFLKFWVCFSLLLMLDLLGFFSVSGRVCWEICSSVQSSNALWTRKLTSIPHEIPLCMNSSLKNVPANRFDSSTWNPLEGFFTKNETKELDVWWSTDCSEPHELDFNGWPFLVLEMRRQNNSSYIFCLTSSIC